MLKKSFIFLMAFSFSFSFSIPYEKKIAAKQADQYIQALKLIGQAKFDEALASLQEIAEKDFTFSKAYQKIFEVLKARNELEAAKDYYEKLLKKNSKNPGALYGLGLYYQEKKDFQKAWENLEKAVNLHSKSPSFYAALINSAEKLNQLDSTKANLSAILKKEPKNGVVYCGLGYLAFKQKEWDEAIVHLDKAVELNPDLLLAYRIKCDVLEAMSKYKESLELALEKVKLCENKDPDLQIDFLTRIGHAHDVLGRYQDSLKIDLDALKIAKEIGNKQKEAIILGNIGVCYSQMGQLQEGLKYFNEKLEITRQIADRSEEAHILTNIGVINSWLGNFQKAFELYKQALVIYEELGNAERKAWIMGNIGVIYEVSSDYPKALGYYREALRIFQSLKYKHYEAWILGNIGAVEAKLGQNKEALGRFEQALSLSREIGEKQNEEWLLANIGLIYSEENALDQGIEYIKMALSIAREIGDKRMQVSHLGNLGELYRRKGEYKESASSLEQGLKIAEEVGERMTKAELFIISGILQRELKDNQKSIEYFNRSLQEGKELNSPRLAWNSDWGLALTYEVEKNYPLAIKHFYDAINTIESVRSKLETESQKISFLAEKIKIYEGLIKLLFKMREKDPTKGYIEDSFQVAERAKSRAFLDLLAEAKIDPAATLPAELTSEEKGLQSQLTTIQQKLLDPNIKKDEKEKFYEELQEIESKYNDFILRLRQKSPKYASLVYPQPYSLKKVQKELLDDKSYLVEFFIGQENSFVWVMSKKKILWFASFTSESEFFEKIKTYENEVSQHKMKMDFRLGKEIYDELLARALEKVPRYSHLIIVPDGLLLRFPFEALVKEIKGGVPRYLLEDFTLTYAPSASTLGEIVMPQEEKTGKPVEFFAIGNPVTQNIEKETFEFMRARGMALSALPYAEEEVLSISRVYEQAGKKTEVYTKENAQEELIKSTKMNQCRIIHFATHGLIDDRAPALSGLLLAPSEVPEGEDGFLRLNEIFNLTLDSDLVTLSACETALGKETKGEGMIGLIRAFFYAGARSIVASLWMVSDQSTSKLMEEFYFNLVQGKNSSDSLRLAKLKLMKSKGALYSHPFFWAPFILITR